MNFETSVKEIKKLYSAINNKDVDVTLTYKGTEYGVSKPWVLRCENREAISDSYEKAAIELAASLKKELLDKVIALESQASSYKKILNAVQKQD